MPYNMWKNIIFMNLKKWQIRILIDNLLYDKISFSREKKTTTNCSRSNFPISNVLKTNLKINFLPNLLILYRITFTKFLVDWDAKSSHRFRRTWSRASSFFEIFFNRYEPELAAKSQFNFDAPILSRYKQRSGRSKLFFARNWYCQLVIGGI